MGKNEWSMLGPFLKGCILEATYIYIFVPQILMTYQLSTCLFATSFAKRSLIKIVAKNHVGEETSI